MGSRLGGGDKAMPERFPRKRPFELLSTFFSYATPVELGRVVYLRYLPLLSPVKRELYVTVRAARVPHGQPADSLDNEGL